MYTYEEYSKQSTLSSYMAGTVLGFLKWSDMTEHDKKTLAKQIQWCYEKSGAEMSDAVKEDLKMLLQS